MDHVTVSLGDEEREEQGQPGRPAWWTKGTGDVDAGHLIGQPSLQAAARASVSFAPVGAIPDGVSHSAVNWQDFEFGETYDIYAGGGAWMP